MPYFAAALARTPDGWTAEEIDLDGLSDVDEVADRIRDVDGDAETSLLFVEEDDEYVAILRVDAGAAEPRLFVSDSQATESYAFAGMLAGAVEDPADPDESSPDSAWSGTPISSLTSVRLGVT